MKKKSTINNDVQLLSLELQKEVMILRQSLTLLKENIELLQNGDGKGLLWNGENALNAAKSLLGHYDHDMVLLDNVIKCSEYVDSLANKK